MLHIGKSVERASDEAILKTHNLEGEGQVTLNLFTGYCIHPTVCLVVAVMALFCDSALFCLGHAIVKCISVTLA